MSEKEPPTKFAPAGRDSLQEIQGQSQKMMALSLMRQLLNAVREKLVILNDKRQIVFVNQCLLDFLQCKDARVLYGARPGEILDCIHASETAGGCGTTEGCRYCGAVLSILSSQQGKADVQECRITRKQDGKALNLQASTTPFEFDGRRYTVLCIGDIGHEKQQKVLERLLFEKVLTGVQQVRQDADRLQEAGEEALQEFRKKTLWFCDRMAEDINGYQNLMAAEKDELQVQPRLVNTLEILKHIARFYQDGEEAQGRHLEVNRRAKDRTLRSDPILLKEVLGHMVRNALEACEEGGTVTLNAEVEGNEIKFMVHNPGFVPEKVQLQIFQRGFTTRGEGRGLGTYTMKMLSERYLKGQVSFTSSPIVGTTFKATYPLAADSV